MAIDNDLLHHIKTLHNQYYALRHAHSIANERGLIISSLEQGRNNYGLTEQGRLQAAKAGQALKALKGNLVLLSSEFLRSIETAEIIQTDISCHSFSIAPQINERHFGDYEGMTNQSYTTVWKRDALDPMQTHDGVESVSQVLKRMTEFIVRCEKKYKNSTVCLISHGDPLQILQTAFERIPPQDHRTLPLITNAEVRELSFKEKDISWIM